MKQKQAKKGKKSLRPQVLMSRKVYISAVFIDSFSVVSIGGSEGEPRGACPPWTLVLPLPFLGLLKQWPHPLQAENYSRC